MSRNLSKDQIEDLLIYCGTTPTKWRGEDMLVCCPVHGESNASMGVSFEKQVCHCFSCGFAGGFSSLLYHSLPEEFKSFKDAVSFLEERYEVSLSLKDITEKAMNILRYEEIQEPQNKEIECAPRYTLAPYMSGKETYGYFFLRGFNYEDMKEYMIGRDTLNRTVTIPVFHRTGELAGIIGRYIDEDRKHNERYKIYNNFKRGNLLYPLDKFKSVNDTAIIVEGSFDAIHMRKAGYTNVLAIMSNEMSETQVRILRSLVSTVIYVGDNDTRGISARDKNVKVLKEAGIKVLLVKDYPSHGKDPCNWTFSEIHKMINSSCKKKLRIRRI